MTSSNGTTVLDRPATCTAAASERRPGGRVAVVVNPTKFAGGDDLSRFRSEVERAVTASGWLCSAWLPTSAVTGGAAEARWAAASGADVVLVAGGDGTVRAVSQELVGTGVPMAILPAGTGNLLARNLAVPLHDVAAAVALACLGRDQAIDVGWLDVDYDGDGKYDDHFAFTVMAGAGFDAAIMAGTDEALKARLGPTAYVISGARALARHRTESSVSADGVPVLSSRSHGFVVGNCGSLTMGLRLMPDADPSDGMLDTVVLLPSTPAEWALAGWSILNRSRRTHRLLPRFRSRCLEYRSDVPQQVEVDGDVVGVARRVRARVQPAALLVRAAPLQATA